LSHLGHFVLLADALEKADIRSLMEVELDVLATDVEEVSRVREDCGGGLLNAFMRSFTESPVLPVDVLDNIEDSIVSAGAAGGETGVGVGAGGGTSSTAAFGCSSVATSSVGASSEGLSATISSFSTPSSISSAALSLMVLLTLLPRVRSLMLDTLLALVSRVPPISLLSDSPRKSSADDLCLKLSPPT